LVQLIENLRNIEHAPSVAQFQRPPDHFTADHEEDEDEMDPEARTNRDDKHVYDPRDLFDEDDKRNDPEKDRANYKEKPEKIEKSATSVHYTETNEGPEAMDTLNDTEEVPENTTLPKSSQDNSFHSSSAPTQQSMVETDAGVHEPRGDGPDPNVPATEKMELDEL